MNPFKSKEIVDNNKKDLKKAIKERIKEYDQPLNILKIMI